MADLKTTQLVELTSSNIDDADLITIVDMSGTPQNKKSLFSSLRARLLATFNFGALTAVSEPLSADLLILSRSGVIKKITADDLFQSRQLFATSNTSRTIGIGARQFTVETHVSFLIGRPRVRLSDDAAPATNWVEGATTAYNEATGVLDIVVDRTGGSGTFSSWTLAVAGQPA